MTTLLHLAALTATVLLLDVCSPPRRSGNVVPAIVVAVVFSLLNFFLDGDQGRAVRPRDPDLGLLFLIMPFIVNTIPLWLTDKLIGSFEIETMGGLLFSAGAITFVNAIFYMVANAQGWASPAPGPRAGSDTGPHVRALDLKPNPCNLPRMRMTRPFTLVALALALVACKGGKTKSSGAGTSDPRRSSPRSTMR